MRYLEGISTNSPIEADNPLIVGQAVHTGIEKSLADAVNEYYLSYPIITDEHINEVMKMETVIPLARAAIPQGGQFEVEISDEDFRGFIDYLVPVSLNLDEKDVICSRCGEKDCLYENSGTCKKGKYGGLYDIYDFKYSNNVSGYKESAQLHLYKYFFERDNP